MKFECKIKFLVVFYKQNFVKKKKKNTVTMQNNKYCSIIVSIDLI